MLDKINAFLNNTTETNLRKLKTSWLEARKVYQQTEVFRFGNPIVDDWEGKVNAWPLDEGLIDYVDRPIITLLKMIFLILMLYRTCH